MATSYNGWPASRYPSQIGINTRWTVLGHDFPGGVKGGDVQVVFEYLVKQLHARVEPIQWYAPGDEWGYNYRLNVNDLSSLSCHASGTAIDYNATRHPNGRRGTFSAAQVKQIRAILAELDGVVRWGGDFSGTPDEMHFEIRGSFTAVATVAKKLRGQVVPAPTPIPVPIPQPGEDGKVKPNEINEYLIQLYATYLATSPDAPGHNWWFSHLVNGSLTPGQVQQAFWNTYRQQHGL